MCLRPLVDCSSSFAFLLFALLLFALLLLLNFTCSKVDDMLFYGGLSARKLQIHSLGVVCTAATGWLTAGVATGVAASVAASVAAGVAASAAASAAACAAACAATGAATGAAAGVATGVATSAAAGVALWLGAQFIASTRRGGAAPTGRTVAATTGQARFTCGADFLLVSVELGEGVSRIHSKLG